MFIDGYKAHMSVPTFNDQDVHKIAVDATKSPEDAVTAYYTYIMARDLERGFALLSSEYLAYTSFEERIRTTPYLSSLSPKPGQAPRQSTNTTKGSG
jgi:hypothetical protein